MDDFLNQLPTLFGVIVGVLGTLLTTTVADRARWRRDQSVRWDSRRLDAYTTYAATLKEVHMVSARLTAPYRQGNAPAVDPATGLEQLAQASLRRSRDWESVILLADEASIKAAREWWKRIRAEEVIARGLPEFDLGQWDQAVLAADHARDRFYEAARASLAVSGGSAAKYVSQN